MHESKVFHLNSLRANWIGCKNTFCKGWNISNLFVCFSNAFYIHIYTAWQISHAVKNWAGNPHEDCPWCFHEDYLVNTPIRSLKGDQDLTLPDWAKSSSPSLETLPPANTLIWIALATTSIGMNARTTSVSFHPLIKAYTRQAIAVLKDIAIVPSLEPAGWNHIV